MSGPGDDRVRDFAGVGGPVRRTWAMPPVYVVAAIAAMVALDRFAPIGTIGGPAARVIGVLLMAGGAAVVLGCDRLFRRAGTTIKPYEPSATLVTRGPYAFSRNPIYLAMVAFLTGVAILLGSWSPFFVVPVFALVIERRFIRAEERALAVRFGPAYDEYRRRVRRWV